MIEKYILNKIVGSETKRVDKIYFNHDGKFIVEIYDSNEDEEETEILKFKNSRELKKYLDKNTYNPKEPQKLEKLQKKLKEAEKVK